MKIYFIISLFFITEAFSLDCVYTFEKEYLNENILSFESVVTFDNSELSFVGIEEMSSDFSFESTESNGIIKIAGATEQDGNTNFELLKLKFILLDDINGLCWGNIILS